MRGRMYWEVNEEDKVNTEKTKFAEVFVYL